MTGGTRKPSSLARAPFLALLAFCQFALAYACTPALIWCPHESSDYDAAYRTAPSPLQKLPSEEFERSLGQFNVTELAIIAEELCVEDLRNNKVLPNATNSLKVSYFPCVIDADVVFQKTYPNKIRTIEDISDDHEFNMILKDVDSNGCIALTGKQCRYSYTERIKRETDKEEKSTEFIIQTDRIILYSTKPLMFKLQATEKAVNASSLQSEGVEASTRKDEEKEKEKENEDVILTLKFPSVENIGTLMLEFYFEVKSFGYYTLNKITYETSNGMGRPLTTRRDISFPFNFSYHCSPETVFVNDTTYLSITEMQVEVDYKNITDEKTDEKKNATFSDAYDCVGFTSIPIWTGIFVTIILGLIMIWALTMIMDIRTMDRFDDPKGKTITISTAE